MRILAGGPARERDSDVFKLHVEGLKAQELHICSCGHDSRYPIHGYDAKCQRCDCQEVNDNGSTVDILHIDVPPLPEQSQDRWPSTAIERVAKARQEMFALSQDYDALWMVDTDVICGPEVLREMVGVTADVVYGVFWSVWDGFETAMPQVWDVHPYDFSSERVVKGLMDGNNVEVLGGGACTLFRGRAFESRYWPLIPGLPGGSMWIGEDRTFALGCCFLQIPQIAAGGLRILHQYRPEDQTPAALQKAKEMVGLC